MCHVRDAAGDTLGDALRRYALQLSAEQIERLEAYCHLLWSWNRRLNLTRHTDFERFVTRDVIDSMQLAGLLKSGERVLDFGTGGGVPGIPVAILRPDVSVALCESIAKKSHAVTDIVQQLALPIDVFSCRVETVLKEPHQFDTLTARAVGPLPDILRLLRPSWASFGRLLLIKGPQWTAERGEARHRGLMQQLHLRKLATYDMPGTSSQSVILALWPKDGAFP